MIFDSRLSGQVIKYSDNIISTETNHNYSEKNIAGSRLKLAGPDGQILKRIELPASNARKNGSAKLFRLTQKSNGYLLDELPNILDTKVSPRYGLSKAVQKPRSEQPLKAR